MRKAWNSWFCDVAPCSIIFQKQIYFCPLSAILLCFLDVFLNTYSVNCQPQILAFYVLTLVLISSMVLAQYFFLKFLAAFLSSLNTFSLCNWRKLITALPPHPSRWRLSIILSTWFAFCHRASFPFFLFLYQIVLLYLLGFECF